MLAPLHSDLMQGSHSRNSSIIKIVKYGKSVKAMSVTTCPLMTNEVLNLALQDLDPSSCHEVKKQTKKNVVLGVLRCSCVSCKTSSFPHLEAAHSPGQEAFAGRLLASSCNFFLFCFVF